MDFYYNSICHMCKQVRPDLKKCASCRFISYCSKEHQISDWKNHKQVCKILSKSKKILTLEENCGYDRWRSYRTDLQFYLMLRLNREILPHESQMWMFPRNCAVCYSVEGLKDCQECFCLCYCSKEHQTLDRETHQRYCSELKLCLDLDRFYLSNPEVDVELKEIDMKVEQLPISIHECIELFLNTSKLNGPLQRIFVTDIFTSMLTILYGLEKCNILKKRNLLNGSLVVHLVGADISESSIDWKYNVELLELWIKNLKYCKFIFVGPDSELISPTQIDDNKKIKIECFKGYYHNIVGKIDKADIIVALNSGLHEFDSSSSDTWDKSLSKLVNKNAPLLLTAYTKNELEEDVKRLQFFHIKTIVNIQKNPFQM